MDGKRKNDNASKQKAKRQKILEKTTVAQVDDTQAAVAQVDDNQADDTQAEKDLKLPPEIWLDIIDYLKKADSCIKNIAGTCKKLYKICSPRLRLKLPFKRIVSEECVIKRAYTDIRIEPKVIKDLNIKNVAMRNIPRKTAITWINIKKFLKSSRKTARKLSIIWNQAAKKKCRIDIHTFLLILECLPNLEEVTLQNVVCFRPKQGKNKDKLPKLSKLKKLTIENVTPLTCSAFKEAENIEELKVKTGFSKNNTSGDYGQLVAKQKNLKLLHSNITLPQCFRENLHLYDVTIGGNNFENIFKNHPKLEHFKHKPGSQLTSETLTAGPPVTSLKTLEIWRLDQNKDDNEDYLDGKGWGDDPADNEVVYNINETRQKFPSLKSFQSYKTMWSASNA